MSETRWIGMKGIVKAEGGRLIFVTDKMRSITVNTAEELMKVKDQVSTSGLLDGRNKAGAALPLENSKDVPSETWYEVNSELLKHHVGHRVEVSADADCDKHLIHVFGVERVDFITKTQIVTALQAEAGLSSREIRVKVHRGKALLRGEVPSVEKRTLAEKIAASFFEVRRVENRILIETAEDREILANNGMGSFPISNNIMSMWLWGGPNHHPLLMVYFHGPDEWHKMKWKYVSKFEKEKTGWAELQSEKVTLRLSLNVDTKEAGVQSGIFNIFNFGENNTFLVLHIGEPSTKQKVVPLGIFDLAVSNGRQQPSVLLLQGNPQLMERINKEVASGQRRSNLWSAIALFIRTRTARKAIPEEGRSHSTPSMMFAQDHQESWHPPMITYRYCYNSHAILPTVPPAKPGFTQKIDASHIPMLDGYKRGDDLTLAYKGEFDDIDYPVIDKVTGLRICEAIYRKYTTSWERPDEYAGPSMNIGDVITLYLGNGAILSFAVERLGFREATEDVQTSKVAERPEYWIRKGGDLLQYLLDKKESMDAK